MPAASAGTADAVRSSGSRDSAGASGSTELAVFSRRPVSEPRHERTVVSTGLADRLAERRHALARLRLRQVALFAAAVLATAAVAWVLLASPAVALRGSAVTVTGSDGSVEDVQVREVLAGYQGDSLLLLDTAEMSAAVEDSLVRVRTAEVTRSWPHGVEVALEMRVPVASYRGEDGYQVLDEEAVVLETADSVPEDLVSIVAQEGADSGDSPQGALSAQQVSAVTQAVGALDPEVLAQVSSGTSTDNGQVTLVMEGGATVVWGGSEDNDLKARALSVLMQTEAAVYDVSSPHNPTTSQSGLPEDSGAQR
ncbi:cell division protein FtsQ/DivIB [Actinomyces lilanjuaniae]|uniref:cell division protein FtsQ/DivIB n=1 Tax=Actinomyces lilanjuaniae TaxID=2321394 RepID=UPI001FAA6D88|nr:FtsQ-type POTRA domain-containing protein [Actinomyces lilanjuaniae]